MKAFYGVPSAYLERILTEGGMTFAPKTWLLEKHENCRNLSAKGNATVFNSMAAILVY